MDLNFNIKPDLIIKNDSVFDVKIINDQLKFQCNEMLFSFWKEYEQILFDNGVSIYGYSIALERNNQYEIDKYLKDFVLIGDDGSGQGLFIKKKDKKLILYYLDLGSIGSIDLYSTNENIFSWIENNPDLEQYEETEEDSAYFEKCDLFIIQIPDNKNKFLFKLKKYLQIEKSIVELSKNIENLPFLVKTNFYPVKYKEKITELNTDYKCLKLQTLEGHVIFGNGTD